MTVTKTQQKALNLERILTPQLMTATTLKKQIVKAIEHIDDENILQAIYTLISNNTPAQEYEFTKEDQRILDERRKKYLSGNAKTYTVAEVRKKVMKNLSKK